MLERSKMLIDEDRLNKFINSHILIVGVGGVGGACFEALVRMGINNISIVDGDSFSLSNLNRQLLSNRNNIGVSKVKEAHFRALSINPGICVNEFNLFLTEANIDDLEYSNYDYIIDCCDTMTTKLLLIKKALENNLKAIVVINKVDKTSARISEVIDEVIDLLIELESKRLNLSIK